MSEPSRTPPGRPRVIVAGSGVGAVETVLALRSLAGSIEIDIDLVAREDHFVYRPLAVVEPFGYPPPYRLPLDRLERTHNVRHIRDAIASVDSERRCITLVDGGELEFDAVVVATGAVAEPWLPGALTFGGSEDVDSFRGLLAELEAGTVDRVLFAVPPEAGWALPLYELALLTTAWLADRGVIGADLTLATPHPAPLFLFGPSAARIVKDLFSARGIHLLTESEVESVDDHGATLAGGHRVSADRVVTLPRLAGNPPHGLPTDDYGFVPIDERGTVEGMRHVYAVGDLTAFAIKQGSVAARQAAAAAAAIAAGLGAPVEAPGFETTVDAVLLTGVTARYLHAELSDTSSPAVTISVKPLWWPPEKIAARYLADYLGEQEDLEGIAELTARAPRAADEKEYRHQQRRLTLKLAHGEANMGQHAAALRWLTVLEAIDGTLQPEHAAMRDRWERARHS